MNETVPGGGGRLAVVLLSFCWLLVAVVSSTSASRYVAYGGAYTFDQAQTFCQSQTVNGVTGKLPTIRNSTEASLVQGIMNVNASDYWLGASSTLTVAAYRWLDDSSPVQYNKFDESFTDAFTCAKIRIYDTVWSPSYCFTTLSVMCEFNPSFVPRTTYTNRFEIYTGFFSSYDEGVRTCQAQTIMGKQGRLANFRTGDDVNLVQAARGDMRNSMGWMGGRRRYPGVGAALIWTDNSQIMTSVGWRDPPTNGYYSGGSPADCVAIRVRLGLNNLDSLTDVPCSKKLTQVVCEFSDVPLPPPKSRYVAFLGLGTDYGLPPLFNRSAAEKVCQNETQDGVVGRLATYRTSKEMELLLASANKFDVYISGYSAGTLYVLWIGGQRLQKGGPFVWDDDNSSVIINRNLFSDYDPQNTSSFELGENCLSLFYSAYAQVSPCNGSLARPGTGRFLTSHANAVLCEFYPRSTSLDSTTLIIIVVCSTGGGLAAIFLVYCILKHSYCKVTKKDPSTATTTGFQPVIVADDIKV